MMYLFPLFASMVSADAQSLEYLWGDHESVRYHFQSQISTPRGFRVYGDTNEDARFLGITVSLDTTCTPTERGRDWDVDCRIDDVSLAGVALAGEEEALDRILREFEGHLETAVIELDIRRNGHIRTVDLEGPPKDNRRRAYIHEQMRQIIRRTVSPLCVQLPRSGEDPGDSWRYRGLHLGFELMSTYGTAGGTRFDQYVDEWISEDEAFVIGTGRGTVGTNLEMGAGSGSDGDGNVYGSSTNPSISMIVVSQTRFDSARGLVLYSELSANGESTAQAMTVAGSSRYNLSAWVGLIREDGVEGLEGLVRPETTSETIEEGGADTSQGGEYEPSDTAPPEVEAEQPMKPVEVLEPDGEPVD